MKVIKRYLPWFLLALALTAAVTFGYLWQEARTAADAEDELRAQAREFIGDLMSISAETAEADAAAIKQWAVGDFADEAEVFYGEKAIDAVVELEATTEGEVQELFIQSLGGWRGICVRGRRPYGDERKYRRAEDRYRPHEHRDDRERGRLEGQPRSYIREPGRKLIRGRSPRRATNSDVSFAVSLLECRR